MYCRRRLLLRRMDTDTEAIMGAAATARGNRMAHAAYPAVMLRESISMAERVMTGITGTA